LVRVEIVFGQIAPTQLKSLSIFADEIAESFFATLEREVLSRRRFKTQAEAKMAIYDWLEGWYNPHRRHSSLGYRSPVNYERHALAQEAA
jgi:putative transposase